MSFIVSATPAAAVTPAGDGSVSRMARMVRISDPPDLAAEVTHDAPTYNVGDIATITVNVINHGSTPVTGIYVTVPAPAGLLFVSAAPTQGFYDPATGLWSVGSLAADERVSLSLSLLIAAADPVTITATIIASDQFDPDMSNNQVSVTIVPLRADLAVQDTFSDLNPNVGDTVTGTFQVSNHGPDNATGIVVSVVLPAGGTFVSATPSQGTYDPATGMWMLGSITPGQHAQLVIGVIADDPRAMVTTASIVAADQFDPDAANNQITIGTTYNSLALQLTSNTMSILPGELVEYTATVRNMDTVAASNIVIRQRWTTGVATFVGASASTGTFDPATGTWAVGALAGSETAILTFSVRGTEYGPLVAQVFYASAADAASATVTVRDITAPLPPTAGINPLPNADGWNRTAVTIHYSANGDVGPGASGLPTQNACSDEQRFASETNGTTTIGTCVDKAGNISLPTTTTVKIDQTAPQLSAQVINDDGTPRVANTFGWYNTAPLVRFTASDPLLGSGQAGSGILVSPNDTLVTTTGTNQVVTGTATDRAGNTTTISTTLQIDTVVPTTTATLSCDETNGWCKGQTATVMLTATDQLAGIHALRYRINDGPMETVSQSTATVNVPLSQIGTAKVQYFAIDMANNAETTRTATIKYDQLGPNVTGSVSPAPNALGWNRLAPIVGFTAVDQSDGSGVNPASVTPNIRITTPTSNLSCYQGTVVHPV